MVDISRRQELPPSVVQVYFDLDREKSGYSFVAITDGSYAVDSHFDLRPGVYPSEKNVRALENAHLFLASTNEFDRVMRYYIGLAKHVGHLPVLPYEQIPVASRTVRQWDLDCAIDDGYLLASYHEPRDLVLVELTPKLYAAQTWAEEFVEKWNQEHPVE